MREYFILTDSIIRKINFRTSSATERVKYYAIVTEVLRCFLYRNEDYYHDGVKLNQKKHLNKLVSSNHSGSLIQDLVSWQILTVFKRGIKRVRATTYKLHDAHYHDQERFKSIPVSRYNTRLTNKSNTPKKQTEDRICKLIEKILINDLRISEVGLRYLSIKYPKLREAIAYYRANINIPEECHEDVWLAAEDLELYNILLKRFEVNRPPAKSRKQMKSRIYYTLTQLNHDLRRVLLLDGKSLHSIDVSSCQPCLSVYLIDNYLRGKSGIAASKFIPPPDFLVYKKACESGELYKILGELYNKYRKEEEPEYTKESHNEFKIQCFKEIFYSKRMKGTLGRVFTELFPSVAGAIQAIKAEKVKPFESKTVNSRRVGSKSENHKNFAIRLQQYESQLMLEKTLKPLLIKGFKVLPLHDAIFVSDESLIPMIQEMIKSNFLKLYGVNVKMKTEDVSKAAKREPAKRRKQKENIEWFKPFIDGKWVTRGEDGVAYAGIDRKMQIFYKTLHVRYKIYMDEYSEKRPMSRKSIEKSLNKHVRGHKRLNEIFDKVFEEYQQSA